MARRSPAARHEQATAPDLMFLAVQDGVVPEQIGAVLVLEPQGRIDVRAAAATLAQRAGTVPRLRQRITGRWPAWARAVWTEDPDFRPERHVSLVACPPPGDEAALLRVAADLVVRRLPLDRPLWRATFVTGLAQGRVALVLVLQHAVADGIGGLAVLRALVDDDPADDAQEPGTGGAQAPGTSTAGAGRPSRPAGRGGTGRIGRAPVCSLLRPTGPRRRITVAQAPLDGLRATAHAHGATVNDVLLAAVAGALHATLEGRGERLPAVVVAVPMADRRRTTAHTLGNRFREIRAALPRRADPVDELEAVAAIMRRRKLSAMGPSASRLASVAVRIAVALGLYELYMRRQRYLHTVVTNVAGPRQRQCLAGAPVVDVLPLAVGGGGNVTVSFAALSYAGTLAVTVTADPGAVPDLDALTAELQSRLDALTAAQPARAGTGRGT